MLPVDERLHGVGAQVIMEFVHMHEGLVWFPAVAGIVGSGPSDIELQSGSSIKGCRGIQGSTHCVELQSTDWRGWDHR